MVLTVPYRVAEINLGIVCACIPVCVPVLKSFSETFSRMVSSSKRYLRKSNRSSDYDDDFGTTKTSGTGVLPRVPRVNLNTLRSLFRDPHDSQRANTQRSVTVTRVTNIELSPYTEVGSVDMDYHRYLVNGHQNSSPYKSVVTSTGGSDQDASAGVKGPVV